MTEIPAKVLNVSKPVPNPLVIHRFVKFLSNRLRVVECRLRLFEV